VAEISHLKSCLFHTLQQKHMHDNHYLSRSVTISLWWLKLATRFVIFKGIVIISQLKFCNHLLTFLSFQICVTLFGILEHNCYFKESFLFIYNESQWGPTQHWKKRIIFYLLQKKCIRVWKDLIMTDWQLQFCELLCNGLKAFKSSSATVTFRHNSYDTDLFDGNSLLPLTKSSCCVSSRQIVHIFLTCQK